MDITERNKRIVAAVEEGRTLQDIGDEYGITRERVRQIAARHGVRSDFWERREIETAAKVRCVRVAVSMGEDPYDACKRFDIHHGTVRIIDPSLVAKRATHPEVRTRAQRGVELVRRGVSIRRAASQVGICAQTLGRHVAKAGIESRYGRWKGKGLAAQFAAGEMV